MLLLAEQRGTIVVNRAMFNLSLLGIVQVVGDCISSQGYFMAFLYAEDWIAICS
jgi:hypothetical protein